MRCQRMRDTFKIGEKRWMKKGKTINDYSTMPCVHASVHWTNSELSLK